MLATRLRPTAASRLWWAMAVRGGGLFAEAAGDEGWGAGDCGNLGGATVQRRRHRHPSPRGLPRNKPLQVLVLEPLLDVGAPLHDASEDASGVATTPSKAALASRRRGKRRRGRRLSKLGSGVVGPIVAAVPISVEVPANAGMATLMAMAKTEARGAL